MAPKKQESQWRPCGDYRGLNVNTMYDHYPLPHIHDFTYGLDGKKIFSSIDLIKTYYQFPVNEEDVKKQQ